MSGRQYGNVTGVAEYEGVLTNGVWGWAATATRRQAYTYSPNGNTWVISRRAIAETFDVAANKRVSEQRFYYDQPGPTYTLQQAPSKGDLTRQEGVGVLNGQYTSGRTWQTFGYASNGNLAWQEDALAHRTTYAYDTLFGGFRVCETNAAGHRSKSVYYGVPGNSGCSAAAGAADYARFGLLQKAEDPNGLVTEYNYDGYRRPLKVARSPDTLTVASQIIAYRPFAEVGPGQPFWVHVQQRDEAGGDGYQHTWTFYDGFGRSVQTQAEAANSQHAETSHSYTWRNAPARSGLPVLLAGAVDTGVAAYRSPGTWSGLRYSQQSYDRLGRLSASTAPDGKVTSSSYAVGNDGASVRRQTAVIDAEQHLTINEQDALGRLRQAKQFSGVYTVFSWTATPYAAARYTYDVADRLVSVVGPQGETTTLAYDDLGRKQALNDPDMGGWAYTYDAAGNLESQTDAIGNSINFKYDVLNRPTEKWQNLGQFSTSLARYYYDETAYGYSKGRRTRSVSYEPSANNVVNNTTAWYYDIRGRVTREDRTISGADGGTFRFDYTYDAADRQKTVRYPGGPAGETGELVTNSYDAAGITRVQGGDGTPYLASASYNAAGQVTQERYDQGSYGLTRSYTYDPNTLRLSTLTGGTASPYTNLQNLTYGYDDVGNVTSLSDALNSSQRQCFRYDALDRLTAAFSGNADCSAYSATGTGAYNHTYAYSASGNLTSYAGNAYTYGSTRPHAVTAALGNPYDYDANGNQTSRTVGGVAYTLDYDADNRLIKARQGSTILATYRYDGDGQRVSASQPRGTLYHEDLADGAANGWTASVGTWTVSGGGYYQSDAGNSNTNSYHSLAQSGALVFHWRVTFNAGGAAGGLHIMASATTSSRGNAYLIWQDSVNIRIYESVGDVQSQRATFPAPNANGQSHAYVASYDPGTGKLEVWRDGVYVGSWTDTTPLTGGAYISLRTNGSSVTFDDISVRRATSYYVANGRRVALRANDTAPVYLLADQLGSTSLLVSRTGQALTRQYYYPYGGNRGGALSELTTVRYTGQRQEDGLPGGEGLYDYGARWYDAYLNRWIQPDSIVPRPGDPQSLNRYSYAANNPLRYTDPTGHYECEDAYRCAPPPTHAPPPLPPAFQAPLLKMQVSGYTFLEDQGGGYYHPGVDYGAGSDPTVHASTAGTVAIAAACPAANCTGLYGKPGATGADYNLGLGNTIIVEYAWGAVPAHVRKALDMQKGQSLFVLYAHLDSAPAVTPGSRVSAGQAMGVVGNTGNSQATHLHLETRIARAGSLTVDQNPVVELSINWYPEYDRTSPYAKTDPNSYKNDDPGVVFCPSGRCTATYR